MCLKGFLKHGERPLTWLNRLQIAIVEKNPQRIDELLADMPAFEDVDDMQSAASLVQEALRLLHALKHETGETLLKLQKHKDFLQSSTDLSESKFNITS